MSKPTSDAPRGSDNFLELRALNVRLVEEEHEEGRPCATYDRYNRIAYVCSRLSTVDMQRVADEVLTRAQTLHDEAQEEA